MSEVDYDHLLSKSDFTVASVNFSNVVQMGNHCNQDYKKKTKDLIIGANGEPEKVAYPNSKTITPTIQ